MTSRNLLFLVFVVFSAISSVNPIVSNFSGQNSIPLLPSNHERQSYEWLVMVYDDGDNSLTDFISEDINEMTAGGSTNNFIMIVLADFGYDRRDVYFDLMNDTAIRSTNTSFTEEYERAILRNNKPAHLYLIKHNSRQELSLSEAGLESEPNMGDPETLIKFVRFCMSNYPAKKTMLVLADHGLSFMGFMQDEYSNDIMTPSELRYAFSSLGYHYNIIGFDACLMASFSMLYEVAQYTDYIIASELTEPAKGWDYTVFSKLTTNPSLEPQEFAREVIDAYAQQYPDVDYTIALFDAHKLIQATLIFDDFINGLLPYASKFQPLFATLRYNPTYGQKEIYYYSNIYDVIALLNRMQQFNSNLPSPAPISSDDFTAVRSAILNTMVYYKYSSTMNPDVYAISIYVPDKYNMRGDFISTLFAQHTQWNEFLYALYINSAKYSTFSKPPQPEIELKNNTLYITLPDSMQFKQYLPSTDGTGNRVFNIMASINGNPLSNGLYRVSSAIIYARTYNGFFYSPLLVLNYTNIEAVYVEAPKEKQTYNLQEGWNMMAIPFQLTEQLTAKDLIDTYYGIDMILYRDNKNKTYQIFSRESPDDANFPLREGATYYVHTTSASIITLYGMPIATPVITLYKGWNLVPVYKDMKASDLHTLSYGKITMVIKDYTHIYDSNYPETDQSLSKGTAIWVYTTEDISFVIT